MYMKFFAASAVATALMSAPAFAATFTLDDFTTVQTAIADPEQTTSVAGGAGTGIAADSRDLFADNSSATQTQDNATKIQSGGNLLSFSNEAGARGLATVTYFGVDLMNDVDTGFFFFDVVDGEGAFDGDAQFSVAGSDGTNSISFTENLASGFNPTLRFSELTFAGPGMFDFRNVDFLSFTIDSTFTSANIDGQLRSIKISAVPVPASGLMLLSALGGVAVLRRRKARKTA